MRENWNWKNKVRASENNAIYRSVIRGERNTRTDTKNWVAKTLKRYCAMHNNFITNVYKIPWKKDAVYVPI